MDTQMGPKMASKTLKSRPRLRGVPGEPFWSHFGITLDPPEVDFRASGGCFWSVRGTFFACFCRGFLRECLLLWEHVPRNFPNFFRDVHAIFDVRGVTETLPPQTAGEGA